MEDTMNAPEATELLATVGLSSATLRRWARIGTIRRFQRNVYSRTDLMKAVDGIKEGKKIKASREKVAINPLERKANIVISGQFGSWTEVAERDYGATSEVCSVEIASLPEHVAKLFHISPDERFFKRVRLTRVGATVICSWATYYPLEAINDILEPLMSGSAAHITEHVKQKHQITAVSNRDVYYSRMTTLEELNKFQLPDDEAILVLQRASYGADKSQLILISDMALLGSWFIHEHEYDMAEAS